MDFTAGKRRQYERLMKEKPGFTRNDELPDEDEREPREREPRKQRKGALSGHKRPNRKRNRED
ncbi:hypothetical protein SK3146_05694 [Paenibacillus konkukensis]|uniref:Uncharacterized protein n=1 Tax=Paenibacillus konkukensis TaxID=2020716 RepID=A0ABY4RUW5_9BACL|nr:hypothetical protein SK3146_05694 [Paenibacillus konkukensis]